VGTAYAPQIAQPVSPYIEAADSHSAVSGGGWVNPSNAFAASGDNVYASADPAPAATISGDFGFPDVGSLAIPDGVTIEEVRVVAEMAGGAGLTLGVQGYRNGVAQGSEVTKTTATEEQVTYTYPGGAVSLADLRSASTLVKARVRATRD
jgi:hypothetical protein